MSFVTWSPATGITAVCRIAPPEKTAMSVVPPPTSTRQAPSSFSSSVSTANEDASCSSTISSTSSPQRCTHLTMFCAALSAPVTMCTRASRRTPDIPTGSRMPSWPSMMNSWGSTWRIFWSAGIGTAWAASMTRATSPLATSLSLMATMPCELRLRTWLPAIPVYTERISMPAISSASSIARWIDCTVESMLTTTPFLRPREGCEPRPMTSRLPSPCISPTSATTFDVPMSRPTIRLRSERLAIDTAISLQLHGEYRHVVLRLAIAAPADREAVRVAHVDVADFGRVSRDHLRGELDEAVHALVHLAPAQAHGDARREIELPGAARIEPERRDLQSEAAEPVLDREEALRNQRLRARRAVETRQLRRHVADARRDQLAAGVEQAVLPPAGRGLLLDDLDADAVRPQALHACTVDPGERLDRAAQAVEVGADESAVQGAERRLLHLDRGDALERAVDHDAAHRPVEADREQYAERGESGHGAGGAACAGPLQLRQFEAAAGRLPAVAVALAEQAHAQVLSRAKLVSSTRQASSAKSMPAARAAIGTSEWPVMPGTVLISSSNPRPLSSMTKSTRPQPEAPVAANVASAMRCSAASASGARPQGMR